MPFGVRLHFFTHVLRVTINNETTEHPFSSIPGLENGFGLLGGIDGMIDEVAFFGRALAEPEIAKLREHGRAGKPLVGQSPENVDNRVRQTDSSGTYTDRRDMVSLHVISGVAAFDPAAVDAIADIKRVRADSESSPFVKEAAEAAIERAHTKDASK